MDYPGLISQFETWIRTAQGHLAKRQLSKLNAVQIPREHKLQIANFARRVDMPLLALRILNKTIRPKLLLDDPPTDPEKAEYAAALLRIGATEEAGELLQETNGQECPQSYLYQSFICFARWDYKSSLPLLKKYHANPLLSKYQKLIAKVNLISARITESKFQQADKTIKQLLQSSEVQKNKLLYGNLLELSAQSGIIQRKYTEAETSLNHATQLLEGSESFTKIYVTKWKALYNLQRWGPSDENLNEIEKVKLQARNLKHWESIRQCDLFLARALRDDSLFYKLIHGSPWAAYRKTITDLYDPKEQSPPTYLWSPGVSKPSMTARIFDVELGEELNSAVAAKPGQLLHRTIKALTQDFYSPLRQGRFYADIYPNEVFNPFSSPLKIRKLVQRLRIWMEKHKIPVKFSVADGEYCFLGKPDYAFQVSLTKIHQPEYEVPFRNILQHFGKNYFSAEEARKHLNYKLSKMKELIDWALRENKLARAGKARATLYRATRISKLK